MRTFGKYRLIEPIASGGMAEVWRAEAPGAAGFVKEVALKLIRGDHDASGEFVEMFIREARLASRLAHGNIVQVFEFDQIDGRYYIAMELVRGRTLRAVVDGCRVAGIRFGLARAVHVGAEVARALAYAHRADHGGLVHRDVSPQNVLLSFEGEVKLADFGIARVLGTTDVTAPGTIKGKLAYMPPEQARGATVDGRADIFSLGVVLWELCTGRRLFARDSDAATLAAVMASDPIAPPSSWNEAVPPELDAIIAGALARDPERRTASAEALATSLAAARLRIATSPADIDPRPLLARLWPDREAPAAAPGGARTEVRDVEAPGPGLTSARGATPVLPVPIASEEGIGSRELDATPAAPAAADAQTRTGVEASLRRTRRRRALNVIAAVSLVVTLAGGARLWTRRGARPSTRAATAREAPIPPPPTVVEAPAPPGARTSVADGMVPPAAAPSQVTQPQVTQRPSRPPRDVRTPPARAPSPGTDAAAAPEPKMAAVSVRALPWAFVRLDGEDVGETPFEGTVRSGSHRIRVHHPTLGDDEIVVTLRPGERYAWRPRLSRP